MLDRLGGVVHLTFISDCAVLIYMYIYIYIYIERERERERDLPFHYM